MIPTHPHFAAITLESTKYRAVLESGDSFRDRYLERYSTRENPDDFNARRNITYVPAFAKAALVDICNTIQSRFADISRDGLPQAYSEAITGAKGGVDGTGKPLNNFLSSEILLELLGMGRVGIYVDRPPKKTAHRSGLNRPPYMYAYRSEQIINYMFEGGVLTRVALVDREYGNDKDGWPHKYNNVNRVLTLTDKGVLVEVEKKEPVLLDLKTIPFVILSLNQSLLRDIADYQIALMNLESSDLQYALLSNFPFYTEQVSPGQVGPINPHTTEEDKATDRNVAVGVVKGRSYSLGSDRPGFIHPSSEPLTVSMQKGVQLRQAITDLMPINLSTTTAGSAAARADASQSKEEGLIQIGAELQTAELKIARIWGGYLDETTDPEIIYPENYALTTIEERLDEADKTIELLHQVPSNTFKREMYKRVASILLSSKIPLSELQTIRKELDNVVVLTTDPAAIREDHEAGLVGTDTASLARGYQAGEAELAKIDHAARLARIQSAQTPKTNSEDSDPEELEDQKTMSQAADENDIPSKRVRGKGKEKGKDK